MNACFSNCNGASRHCGGESPSGQLPARWVNSNLSASLCVPSWSSQSVASIVLSAYVPRGALHLAPRNHSVRVACVAATTSQATHVQEIRAGSFSRQHDSLLNLQDRARQLRTNLKDGSAPTAYTPGCNVVIRGLCAAGERWSNVLQFYNEVWQARVPVDLVTYRALYDAAIEAHHYLDVVDLLRHSQQQYGCAPLQLYCTLISRLLKHAARGSPARQAAHAVWRDLRAAHPRLDAAAYRIGMNLCVELGRLREASQLVEAMRGAGLRPGWGAYHILMKYHARRGDMDAARRLFKQLRAYRGGRPPGISAYNTLLAGFTRLGDLTMARAVLHKAVREGVRPDAASYSALAAGLAAAGRLAEAEALLAEAAEAGVAPCGVLYGALLDGCAKSNDWERADRLLSRMRAEGLQPSLVHYNILIRGRCYSAPAAAAPALGAAAAAGAAAVERAGAGGERGGGGGGGGGGVVVHGSYAVRTGHQDTSTTITNNSSGGSSNSGSSSSDGLRINRPHRPHRNTSTSSLSPSDTSITSSSSSSSNSTSSSFGGEGRDGGLEDLFSFASSCTAPSDGSGSDSGFSGSSHPADLPPAAPHTSVRISSPGGPIMWAGGHVDALLAEMRAAGLRPDAVTYGTLLNAAVRSGSIDCAMHVLSCMRVEGVAADGATYTCLMKLFRTQGQQAQALEFFRQLASSRTAAPDLWALNCLTAVHASAGDMQAAEAAVRQANQLAAEQGAPPPPEATYALLQGYGQSRELQPALAAFRRFLAAGGRPHRKMCEYVYRLCLSQFDFGAAGQVLRAMRLMRFLQLREELYRRLWEEAQQRLRARRLQAANSSSGGGGGGGGGSANSAAEKWKWWFGLPNKYYDSEWR